MLRSRFNWWICSKCSICKPLLRVILTPSQGHPSKLHLRPAFSQNLIYFLNVEKNIKVFLDALASLDFKLWVSLPFSASAFTGLSELLVHQSILVKPPLALCSSNIEVRPSWPEGGELWVWNIVNEQEQYTNNLFGSLQRLILLSGISGAFIILPQGSLFVPKS